MNTKLIKRVQVVQEYLLVGDAHSSHHSYWDRDFVEKRRISVGQSITTEIHKLREMSDAEVALFVAGQGDD